MSIANETHSYILNIGRNKETGRYGLYDILNNTKNAIKKIKENTPSVSIASPISSTSIVDEKNKKVKFSLNSSDEFELTDREKSNRY